MNPQLISFLKMNTNEEFVACLSSAIYAFLGGLLGSFKKGITLGLARRFFFGHDFLSLFSLGSENPTLSLIRSYETVPDRCPLIVDPLQFKWVVLKNSL
jgi:hypothetical protein